jgi:hypothetical protein
VFLQGHRVDSISDGSHRRGCRRRDQQALRRPHILAVRAPAVHVLEVTRPLALCSHGNLAAVTRCA